MSTKEPLVGGHDMELAMPRVQKVSEDGTPRHMAQKRCAISGKTVAGLGDILRRRVSATQPGWLAGSGCQRDRARVADAGALGRMNRSYEEIGREIGLR